MAVILGNASRPSFDAAGAMLQNKQIETNKQIAMAQIKAANARAAMGMAENAIGMLNQNSQRDKDRAAQAQRDAMIRAENQRTAEMNARTRRANGLAEEIRRENEKWRQYRDQWKMRGMQHDPRQEAALMQIEQKISELAQKYNDLVKSGDNVAADAVLGQILNVQHNRWIHEPTTPIPPTIDKDPETGRRFTRDPNGKIQWADKDPADVAKENAEHALKVKKEEAENRERSVKLFELLWHGGTDWNAAADSAMKTHGVDPVGGVRKLPTEDGYKFMSPAAANADWAKEKYFTDKRVEIEKSVREATDDFGKKEFANPQSIQEEVDRRFKPYQALEQKWRASQNPGQQQQPQAQAAPSGIPQDVQSAMEFIQKVTEWTQPQPGFPNGKPIPASQLETTKKALSEAKSLVDSYKQSQGIPVQQPSPQPQQAPVATEQPAAPAEAPKGPYKGKVINRQTSALGGDLSGGGLAMGPSVYEGINRMAGAFAPRSESSGALPTAPDASTRYGDGDVQQDLSAMTGFKEKMQAWLERNPEPNGGPYFPVKGTTNPGAYATGGPDNDPVDAKSASESFGLALPSFSSGSGSKSLGSLSGSRSDMQQMLSAIDDWKAAHPGEDVSAIRKAIESLWNKPKVSLSPSALQKASDAFSKLSADELAEYKRLNPESARFAQSMQASGASASAAVKAASQAQSLMSKAVSGAGSVSRSLGGLGNILTMLGWAGSHLQATKFYPDKKYMQWAASRMAVENAQAESFGIPLDQARQISNSLDGYRNKLKPTHSSQSQSKADKVVPPVTPAERQPGWKHDSPLSENLPSRTKAQQLSDAEIIGPADYSKWGIAEDGSRPESRSGGIDLQQDQRRDKSSPGVWIRSDGPTNRGRGQYGEPHAILIDKPRDFGNIPIPGSKLGSRSYSEPFLEEQFFDGPDERQNSIVTMHGKSPTGKMPEKAEQSSESASEKTAEANQQINEAADAGQLPFDVEWKYDDLPKGATKFPAYEWVDKDGKRQVSDDWKGVHNFIDKVSKSMEVGKYDPANKPAEQAATEPSEETPAAQPLPDDLSLHGAKYFLGPDMQEAHLRTPKTPSFQEFSEMMRGPDGSGREPSREEYQDFINAREAVRSALPKSAAQTAPGNLFLDKDGTLKRSDGRKGQPVGENEPLPSTYQNIVPPSRLQKNLSEQPAARQGRPVLNGLDANAIRQGAAAARDKMADEARRSPFQQQLDRMDRQQADEARNFGQPRPDDAARRKAAEDRLRQEQQRLDELKKRAEEMRDGINDRIQRIKDNRVFGFPENISQNQPLPNFQFSTFDRQPEFDQPYPSYLGGYSPSYTPASYQQFQPEYASPSMPQPDYFNGPSFQPSYQQPDYFPQFDYQPSYSNSLPAPYGFPGTYEGLDFYSGGYYDYNTDYIPPQETFDYNSIGNYGSYV